VERPPFEVGEILRRFEPGYRQLYGGLSPDQGRVVRALTSCRTAALGGHVEACDACGHRVIAYNSCRDRHCPKCQASATAEWLERERAYLLPTPYVHVVFTLPHLLAPLALQNPRTAYGLLFRAAAGTLLKIAADPGHLGARIGFVAILHTWGQTLLHHPHLHCLVPAGGLAPDGSRWVACRKGYFLPVRVLGALFRGIYLALLDREFNKGALRFHGALRDLTHPTSFRRLLRETRRRRWVVYAKPPFGGPEPVLKYLARYTHRIAISNSRILEVEADAVTFAWKDYRNADRAATMRLPGTEFMRRFLLHALPRGFVRIRRFGLLSNAQREIQLARCRVALGNAPAVPQPDAAPDAADATPDGSEVSGGPSTGTSPCTVCRQGRMRLVERLAPLRSNFARAPPRIGGS
jgi:hypothetical protein